MTTKTNRASQPPRRAASAAAPLQVVLLLAGAVLLAHLLVLSQSPGPLGLSQPAREVVSMRLVVPAAPVPDGAPTVATERTTPRPARAAAATAEAPTPSSGAEPVPTEPVLAQHMAPQAIPQAAASAAVPAASAPAPTPAPTPAAIPTAVPTAPPAATAAASASAPPAPEALPPTSAWVPAYRVPASARLTYLVQANKFPFSVNAELVWHAEAQRYEARLTISAFGQARTQTSRGLITAQGLAPERFSDKYRSEVAAHFNRDTGKATFSANTPDVLLSPGAQDRLSLLLQLGAMAAGTPAQFTEGTTFAVQTVGPRDADTWLLTVQGEEPLVLPGGPQTGLKLMRKPRKEFDQRVELWLGTGMAYLPVRLKITEANGDYLDLKWLATDKAP